MTDKEVKRLLKRKVKSVTKLDANKKYIIQVDLRECESKEAMGKIMMVLNRILSDAGLENFRVVPLTKNEISGLTFYEIINE